MKLIKFFTIYILLLILCLNSRSNNMNKDSLLYIFNISSDTTKISAAINLLEVNYYTRDNELSRRIINECKKHLDSISDKMFAQYNHSVGTYFFQTGNFDKALKHYNTSLKLFEKLNIENRRISSNLNIGIIYKYQKKYIESADIFLYTIIESKKRGFHKLSAYSYYNYALLASELNFFELVEFLTERGIKECITDDTNYIKKRLIQLKASATIDLNFNDTILNELNRCSEYFKSKGYSHAEMECQYDIALFYLKKKQYKKAEDIFLKHLKYSEKVNDEYFVFLNLSQLANLYMITGNTYNCIKYGKRVISDHSIHRGLIRYNSVFKVLSDVYYKNGNKSKSHKYLKLYRHRMDSLLKDHLIKSRLIVNKNIKISNKYYDNLLNEQSTRQSSKLVQQNKTIFIYIISGGVILFFVLLFIIRYKLRLSRHLKKISELNNTNIKLNDIAKNNIIPLLEKLHNSNNIEYYSDKESQDIKSFYNYHMANELNDTILKLLFWSDIETYKTQYSFVNISSIINKATEKYKPVIDSKKLIIDIKYDKANEKYIKKSDTSIIYFVVKNIISNTIKYSHYNSTISIYIMSSQNKITVEFTNHGKQITADILKRLLRSPINSLELNDNIEKGLGISLYLSDIYIKKLKGNISIENHGNESIKTTIKF